MAFYHSYSQMLRADNALGSISVPAASDRRTSTIGLVNPSSAYRAEYLCCSLLDDDALPQILC